MRKLACLDSSTGSWALLYDIAWGFLYEPRWEKFQVCTMFRSNMNCILVPQNDNKSATTCALAELDARTLTIKVPHLRL